MFNGAGFFDHLIILVVSAGLCKNKWHARIDQLQKKKHTCDSKLGSFDGSWCTEHDGINFVATTGKFMD